MNEKNQAELPDQLPDRLSCDPKSPYYNEAVLARDVGIRFRGMEKTNVEEYCVSEGWIRVTAGNAKDRYGVWYGLLNTTTGQRLWVKTLVNDPEPTVPSVYPLWRGADWMEREVYDMYGVVFDGHPDLRRILMPDEYTAFPLRKDYPMRGRGERHNFPVLTRAEG